MPKFVIDPDAVQSLVIRQIESWLETLPETERNQPFVTAAGENPTLTPNEILENIQNGTELGVQLMQHAAALAISETFTGG